MNKEEGLNIRAIAADYIKDPNARILELGPLIRCLLDRKKYRNYFFGDVRSTEEIRQLYSGNEYLKRTGLEVDLEKIIDIDFVIKDSYKETFKNIEKFDYVIVSHVLEHIPNLLFFFEDIQNILKPKGELIILYPDRRFSFDYYRSESKFSDIYDVYKNGEERTAGQVLDFYTNVIKENDPTKFWNKNFSIKLPTEAKDKDFELYKSVRKGTRESDIHYWPFSDIGFLKFLYDCSRLGILKFSVVDFVPTQVNNQEFLVILNWLGEFKENDYHRYRTMAYNNYYDHFLRLAAYKNSVKEKKIIIKSLEQEVLKIQKDLEIANCERKQLSNEIDKITSSKSWRITEPLRTIRRICQEKKFK